MRTPDGTRLPVGATSAEPGQTVEIGIRPEHYRRAAEGDPDGFPFIAAVMEPTGAETHLFGTIAGVEVRCVFRERIDVLPGSTLHLTVDRRHVHVFDPATGLYL